MTGMATICLSFEETTQMSTSYTIEIPGRMITRDRSKGRREPSTVLAHSLKREEVLTTLFNLSKVKRADLWIVEVTTSLKAGYSPERRIVNDLGFFSPEAIAEDARKEHLSTLIWDAKHGLTREAAESARAELASMGLMWDGQRIQQ